MLEGLHVLELLFESNSLRLHRGKFEDNSLALNSVVAGYKDRLALVFVQ